MSTQASTAALENARARLRADPRIGMGNYFFKAMEVFSDECRLLTPMTPLVTAWGERCDSPTLRDWGRLADGYARCYADAGVGPMDPIGVYGGFGPAYLLHFLALTRLGAIPVLVNGAMPADIAGAYLQRVGVAGVFTDDERRAALRQASVRPGGFLAIDADFRQVPTRAVVPYEHDPHDPVLITHSSGTTGPPKPVMVQHGPFFHPFLRSLEQPRDPATRCAVCALPNSHNSAMGAVAIAVVNGEELILMAGTDGTAVIEAVAAHRATCVVAFPQTYVDIIAASPEPGTLESVEMWVNLGDAAHEAHISALMRYGTHRRGEVTAAGSRFVDGLGSSEMGSMLFTMVHAPGSRVFGRCVGAPQPWIEVEILDAEGRRLPDGQPGRLAVRGPGVFSGYWNNHALTYSSLLRGHFLTGDIAYRDTLGRLHHLDRVSDTVATDDGPIYTLIHEEAVMNAVDDVLDCCVVATESATGSAYLRCLVVLKPERHREAEALKSQINATLAAAPLRPIDDVRVVPRAEIPVGMTGKTLKARMREALRRDLGQDGQPSVVAVPASATASADSGAPADGRAGNPTATHAPEIVRGDWVGGFGGVGTIQLGDLQCLVGAPAVFGGSGEGVAPSTLLIAAASGCYLLTLASVLEQHGVDVAGISMESEGIYGDALPPQLRAVIHRPTLVLGRPVAAKAALVRRCLEAAKRQCAVARSMPGVEFTVEGTITTTQGSSTSLASAGPEGHEEGDMRWTQSR